MLLLANAIIFAVATVVIYILGLANVTKFNKWLIYFYTLLFCVLSVVIYIRVIYKYVSVILVSAFGWILCGMVYVSLPHIHNIALIFVVAAYQLIVTFISILVNLHLAKRTDKFRAIKKRFIKSKENEKV